MYTQFHWRKLDLPEWSDFPLERSGYHVEIRLSAVDGAFGFSWERYNSPVRQVSDDYYGWNFVVWTPQDHYPTYPDRFSILKSDFLRKKLGFDLAWWDGRDPKTGQEGLYLRAILVPQWFVLLFCPWLPLIWFRRFRRRRIRLKKGLCLNCGFNLRAHHPGDKCPECGTEVPSPLTLAQPPHP